MKKFTLACENDHEFEGWFADGNAIRKQAAQGFLDCPYCGSTQIDKRLSAPNISSSKTRARNKSIEHGSVDHGPAEYGDDAEIIAREPETAVAGPPDSADLAAMRVAMRQMQKKIKAEFTDVGDKFAEEARKIHDGESEKQSIYGTCSREEQIQLAEDGIEVFSLPELPPEH